jgi:hypothetical protein
MAIIWAFIPLVLTMMPANYFDDGQSICLSVLLLGQECYACGLTRATMHLIHFDFEIAYTLNKASFVLFPLLVYLWGQMLHRIFRLIYPK